MAKSEAVTICGIYWNQRMGRQRVPTRPFKQSEAAIITNDEDKHLNHDAQKRRFSSCFQFHQPVCRVRRKRRLRMFDEQVGLTYIG